MRTRILIFMQINVINNLIVFNGSLHTDRSVISCDFWRTLRLTFSVWTETFLRIPSFVFRRRKGEIHTGLNDDRMIGNGWTVPLRRENLRHFLTKCATLCRMKWVSRSAWSHTCVSDLHLKLNLHIVDANDYWMPLSHLSQVLHAVRARLYYEFLEEM